MRERLAPIPPALEHRVAAGMPSNLGVPGQYCIVHGTYAPSVPGRQATVAMPPLLSPLPTHPPPGYTWEQYVAVMQLGYGPHSVPASPMEASQAAPFPLQDTKSKEQVYHCQACNIERGWQIQELHKGSAPRPSLCRNCRKTPGLKFIIDTLDNGRLNLDLSVFHWCGKCGIQRSAAYHEAHPLGSRPPLHGVCKACRTKKENSGRRHASNPTGDPAKHGARTERYHETQSSEPSPVDSTFSSDTSFISGTPISASPAAGGCTLVPTTTVVAIDPSSPGTVLAHGLPTPEASPIKGTRAYRQPSVEDLTVEDLASSPGNNTARPTQPSSKAFQPAEEASPIVQEGPQQNPGGRAVHFQEPEISDSIDAPIYFDEETRIALKLAAAADAAANMAKKRTASTARTPCWNDPDQLHWQNGPGFDDFFAPESSGGKATDDDDDNCFSVPQMSLSDMYPATPPQFKKTDGYRSPRRLGPSPRRRSIKKREDRHQLQPVAGTAPNGRMAAPAASRPRHLAPGETLSLRPRRHRLTPRTPFAPPPTPANVFDKHTRRWAGDYNDHGDNRHWKEGRSTPFRENWGTPKLDRHIAGLGLGRDDPFTSRHYGQTGFSPDPLSRHYFHPGANYSPMSVHTVVDSTVAGFDNPRAEVFEFYSDAGDDGDYRARRGGGGRQHHGRHRYAAIMDRGYDTPSSIYAHTGHTTDEGSAF
ncbi:hypothetical protein B0T17DRAFT_614358 [Bombardia bombarda]|uniref:Uncharacterized protein n=1 Tax=Bombardia bombarda TaxID=252184 RepID=A0AA39X701_9PEZI|nr:hypothetical protein B0T17DRAFT_614358 [Bombardia bombarda]